MEIPLTGGFQANAMGCRNRTEGNRQGRVCRQDRVTLDRPGAGSSDEGSAQRQRFCMTLPPAGKRVSKVCDSDEAVRITVGAMGLAQQHGIIPQKTVGEGCGQPVGEIIPIAQKAIMDGPLQSAGIGKTAQRKGRRKP